MEKDVFVGKICPYCKTNIMENDDIVICSICNMPHHKECWIENQGCTTFGCTGTIMNPWEEKSSEIEPVENESVIARTDAIIPESSSENASKPMFCSKCGAKRKAESNFCRICGAKFKH